MSPRRKVTRERPAREQYLQISDQDAKRVFGNTPLPPGSRVFVAVPSRICPPLTAEQRSAIVSSTNLHLTDAEWLAIEDARNNSADQFYALRDGLECDSLVGRLRAMRDAANVLLCSAPETGRNSSETGEAEAVAWARIAKTEGPPFTRDDTYPIISMLANRIHLALQAAEMEKTTEARARPHQRDFLVKGLKDIFEAKGKRAPRSKPHDHGAPYNPSEFAAFVIAVAKTLPDEIADLPRTEENRSIAAIAETLRRI